MTVRENVPLASLTTLHIGGAARYFIEAKSVDDVREALHFASEKNLTLFVLGAGSNLLVPDEGVNGVVLKIMMDGIEYRIAGEECRIIADANARWDDVVDAAIGRGLFGIENLAGVPGTAGGAVVQNIGAYGAELAQVVEYIDAIDRAAGTSIRLSRAQAAFGYRTSVFKEKNNLIITRATLILLAHGRLNVAYPDLVRVQRAGAALITPKDVAQAVRAIRSDKFPQNGEAGTAGSFFKNPVIPKKRAEDLVRRYPGLPVFLQKGGLAKLSLAWLLDHALSLKGYAVGGARLYEKQPLVIVTHGGATAKDVDTLAQEVAARVQDATGIVIEREVETFGR